MKGSTNAITSGSPVFYTITANPGTGGTIVVNPSSVQKGHSAVATITPNATYNIQSVTVDGIEQGAISTFTFTNVREDHVIAATFTQNTHTITVTQPAHGTISPGTGQYAEGGNHVFNLNADNGYEIHTVTYNGTTQQWAANQFTTDPLTADATLTCEFVLKEYTITPSAVGNCTITPSTQQTVSHGGTATFVMSIGVGADLEHFLIDGVETPMTSTSYVFNNVQANHTISIECSTRKYDIVSSAGANGTIDPSGTTQVPHGSSQKYTFNPDQGYVVDTVLVDGSAVTVSGNEYTFVNVTEAHTISVTFKVQTFTITPTVSGGGTITPASVQTVSYGGNCTFTITPLSGAILAHFLVDGVETPLTATTYEFTNVTANHTIEAQFVGIVYTVTASAGANGSIDPSGDVEVAHSANKTFTFSPDTGYEVDKVTVDGSEVTMTGTNEYTMTNVLSDHTINVTFKKRKFTLTPVIVGNGTITPSTVQTVEYGDNFTFTITPASGATLNSFKIDGVITTLTSTTYEFTNVTANHTIEADFSDVTYKITASAGSHGSINPSGEITVTHGHNQTFTFTADTGYQVEKVTVDGSAVTPTTETTYEFINVSANHTINVTFEKKTYTISGTTTGAVVVTPTLPYTAEYGDTKTFTFSPATGHSLTEVKVDGVVQSPIPSSYTFTDISADHTLDVSTQVDTFVINSNSDTNGTIYPLGSNTYNYGDTPTYTWYPNTHYKLSKLKIDGVEQTPLPTGDTYTFAAVTSNHSIAVEFEQIYIDITPVKSGDGTGTITPATAHVAEGGSQTFTFAADISSDITKVLVNGVAQTLPLTEYTFTNVSGSPSLEVEFTKKSFTLTASSGSGGSVSPTSVTKKWGENQTLTFTPITGFEVSGLERDGTLQAYTSTTYEESNIQANHTYVVNFTKIPYTITTTAGANGTISPTNPSVYHGDNCTLTITPDTGYHVADVLVDSASVGAVTTYTFTNVTSTHTISATFAIDTFTFTATAGTGGTISSGASQTIDYDGSASVTAAPIAGYKIKSYTRPGVGDVAVTTNTFTVEHILADTAITVNFEQIDYVISVTVPSGNGTASSDKASVHYGESANISFTPDTNYYCSSITINGVTTTNPTSPVAITNIQINQTIVVAFSLKPTVTITTTGTGTTSPTGVQYIYPGNSLSVTMEVADDTNTLDYIKVDSAAVTPTVITANRKWSYTISNITANKTVDVAYKANTFTVTPSIVGSYPAGGTITPSSVQTVAYGGSVTFTVAAAAGYKVKSVKRDSTELGTEAGQYNLTSIVANTSFTAEFEENPTVEFTVLDNSDPTAGFTYPTEYQTESARTTYLQSHCHPALVGDDGTVLHWMKWTDMTHDATTGDAVTIDGTAGSVFALWDRVWYKAETVSGGMKYLFTFSESSPGTGYVSPMQYDDSTLGDYAGMGVFGAINSSGKLISGNVSSTPTVSQTQNTFYTQAINRDGGDQFNQNFPTLVAFYKIMLLFEKGNKNTQAAYGNGMSNTSKGAVNLDWDSTNAWNKGDTSVKTKGVTALGIHNFWGNVFEFMGEMKIGATANKVGFATKWSDHQNIETAGYPSTWHEVSGSISSSGYIKSMVADSVDPFIPSAVSGSSTTYYCDYGYGNTSTERCVYVGGRYDADDTCGAFCWSGYYAVDYSYSDFGSRLCVII